MPRRSSADLLNSGVFRLSIGIGVSLLLIQLFQWALPFPLFMLTALFQLGLFGVFGFVFLWSIVYGIRQLRRQKLKALVPVVINAIVLLMLIHVPFLTLWLKLNFVVMESARNEVVSLVRSGQLEANATLPAAYALTSEGGRIAQENGNILFYTFSGIDNYAGFVYVSSSVAPAIGDWTFGGKVIEVKPFQPQWFWISAT